MNLTNTLQSRYIEVLPYTLSSEERQVIIQQDINKDPNAKPILMSENERTGIEFAYSFYLYVLEKTFDSGEKVLKSVFYKGYDSTPWPLLAPGVFMLGSTNTMRIVFNSYNEAYNYIDIDNMFRGFRVMLIVLTHSSKIIKPSKSTFNYPAFRNNLKTHIYNFMSNSK
jgi:hypothetical protein